MIEYSYGVVPVRHLDGRPEVLLIKNKGGHWSFPKGHPEGDETGIETARRELREETGIVECDIQEATTFVERFQFEKAGRTVDREITFYLGMVTSAQLVADPHAVHESIWLPFDRALKQLTYPESKQILRDVIAYFDRKRSE